MTLYDLKPRFQAWLRPLVRRMALAGVTANAVTLTAMLISVAFGAGLALNGRPLWCFALLPAWLALRMALNAMDGMLAREFGQQSRLGGYLNELADVVSDSALYLPFALIAPFSAGWTVVAVLLAALSELAGVLGVAAGASRRYDGPLGKSDRALVFGALGLWLGIVGSLPAATAWLMPALALLLLWTVANRVRAGLAEAGPAWPDAGRKGLP